MRLEVGVVGGVRDSGFEFPEPGGVGQRRLVVNDEGQDANGLVVG
ncbi:MAG TPA: hypothetical protein VFO16_24275 [Pseudonocardiaceae bacterium]|nr:hypothetical protein [Pseudonocardiaceae bacterium]